LCWYVLDDFVGAMAVCHHLDEDIAQGLRIFLTPVDNRIPAFALLMMAESG
jgi:hypothetical protein